MNRYTTNHATTVDAVSPRHFCDCKSRRLLKNSKKNNIVFQVIKFTIETEENGRLPFVDVVVSRTPEGGLETSVYCKSTRLDDIFNYKSKYPNAHKWSCVQTLFKKYAHFAAPRLQNAEGKDNATGTREMSWDAVWTFNKAIRSRKKNQNMITKRVALPYVKNVSTMTVRHFRLVDLMVAL